MTYLTPEERINNLKAALTLARDENEHLKFVIAELTTPAADWNKQFFERGLSLTVKEARIVGLLSKKAGECVPYDALAFAVTWDSPDADATTNLLHVYLCRIRKKMVKGKIPAKIRTVYKRGVMWVNKDAEARGWLA